MTPQLKDLLFKMRQHPAFQELLNEIDCPEPKSYRPPGQHGSSAAEQNADWIFRSGRKAQHEAWRALLTETAPDAGSITSQQEKS